MTGKSWIVAGEEWWWNVKFFLPGQKPLCPIFSGGLPPVQTLKGAIMPFIQAPIFLYLNVGELHGIEHDLKCFSCSAEVRGKT